MRKIFACGGISRSRDASRKGEGGVLRNGEHEGKVAEVGEIAGELEGALHAGTAGGGIVVGDDERVGPWRVRALHSMRRKTLFYTPRPLLYTAARFDAFSMERHGQRDRPRRAA